MYPNTSWALRFLLSCARIQLCIVFCRGGHPGWACLCLQNPTKAWIFVMQGRSLVISGMVSCILLVRLPAVRILRECGDEDIGGSDDFEDCTRGHAQALLDVVATCWIDRGFCPNFTCRRGVGWGGVLKSHRLLSLGTRRRCRHV